MPAAPLAALMGARLNGAANVIGAGSEHLSDKSIVGSRCIFHAGLAGTAVTTPRSTMNSPPVE